MTNPWQNMDTSKLYSALLSNNPEQALKDLERSQRALQLGANRARIRAGKKLMNHFNYLIISLIREYQEEHKDNYIAEIRELTANDVINEVWDDKLEKLILDYMEYCYD